MNSTPKNNKELSVLITTYDKNYFDGGIGEMLKKKKLVLNPILSNRTTGLKYIVGYDPDLPGYYIDISQRLDLKSFKISLQYALVKLLMIMLGYYIREPRSVYGDGGKLMSCVYKKIYGVLDFHNPYIVWDDPPTLEEKDVETKLVPVKGYSYWENSCYIDSLLVTILLNYSRFWRRATIFSDLGPYTKGFENCSKERMTTLASDIQNDLSSDFISFAVHKSEEKNCRKVRNLIAECLPLKEGDSWTTYNVADLYSTFGVLFPELNFDIPYRLHRSHPERGLVRGWLQYSRESVLTMWDFMDPHSTEDTHKRIEWNMCRSPVLVFTNGGTPRIKHFGSMESETVKTAYSRSYNTITKRDAFGDTIISGRYQIVGVILLLGVKSDQDGGAHYISYFKATDGSWYYYDDLREDIVQIVSLPDKVWNESSGSMPAMYFYQIVEK